MTEQPPSPTPDDSDPTRPTDGGAPAPGEPANPLLRLFGGTSSSEGTNAFSQRFHSFFGKEGIHPPDSSDDRPWDSPEETAVAEPRSDEERPADLPDGQSNEEERGGPADDLPDMAQEEAEALAENIEAMNRNEDDTDLFALGRKYDPDDDVNIPDDETVERSPTSILEAMFFVGDRDNRPLELSRAVGLMRNVTVEEGKRCIDELNRRYEARQSPYRIVREENGYRMVLLPEAAAVSENFGSKVRQVKLQQKVIEILAIIAYRQPVTLDEIQDVRPGTTALVSQLIRRGLICAESKQAQKKSLTYYRTTPRFLSVLGIESLDELPMIDEIDYR